MRIRKEIVSMSIKVVSSFVPFFPCILVGLLASYLASVGVLGRTLAIALSFVVGVSAAVTTRYYAEKWLKWLWAKLFETPSASS